MTTNFRPHSYFWRLAAAQHGAVADRQLRAGGLSRAAIRHRRASGRLWPVHPWVYAVGRPELSAEGRWMAAVLAGGPGTVLSHHSAAALWDLRADRRGELPHISVPGRRGHPGTPRVVIHRPEALGEADFTRRRGIPVTSLERTLVDLALFLRDADLKAALREAEFRYRLDLAELRRGLDGHPRSRKHARLRRLLDEWVPGIALTESELEALFLELCARARLPLPSPQVRLGRHRADFLWPAARLVVEVDGYEGHRGRIAFTEDRVKDRRLVARGYVVLRFTRAEVVARPAAVAKEMRAALKRLSAGAQAAL